MDEFGGDGTDRPTAAAVRARRDVRPTLVYAGEFGVRLRGCLFDDTTCDDSLDDGPAGSWPRPPPAQPALSDDTASVNQ